MRYTWVVYVKDGQPHVRGNLRALGLKSLLQQHATPESLADAVRARGGDAVVGMDPATCPGCAGNVVPDKRPPAVVVDGVAVARLAASFIDIAS